MREVPVEIGVHRDHLDAEPFQHLRREGAGGAVAAGGDDLQLALDLRTVGQVLQINFRKILDKAIGAAVA